MKLSICCLSYNHEAFISKAIDGFLMQSIDVDYEIIIADDASTDNSQHIIKNYQKKYPELIKIILNKRNIGAAENFRRVLAAASGDYIAYCDGDDFWNSRNKIKIQIEALDANPVCSFSFHDVDVVDINGAFINKHSQGRITQNSVNGIMNNRKIIGAPLLIAHSNSLLFRRKYLDLNYLNYLGDCTGLDFPLLLSLCSCGHGYYFKDAMSSYRSHDKSISHSRRMSENVINEIREKYDLMDKYYDGIFHLEIKRNYKGHRVNKILTDLDLMLESRKYFKSILVSIKLLFGHDDSQYSLRDIIWLLRKKWKMSAH